MTSGDPTPRFLAAAASLSGTGILMCRPDPSWTGILIGLLCLGLWALGTLAARPSRAAAAGTTSRPRILEAVIVETPPPTLILLPAPRPGGPAGASRLPEVSTHRQRVVARGSRQRR